MCCQGGGIYQDFGICREEDDERYNEDDIKDQ